LRWRFKSSLLGCDTV